MRVRTWKLLHGWPVAVGMMHCSTTRCFCHTHTHTHARMHTHTICYRHTGRAGVRCLLHITHRQKHIQIPYVVNIHDRAAYDLHEIHLLLNQRSKLKKKETSLIHHHFKILYACFQLQFLGN